MLWGRPGPRRRSLVAAVLAGGLTAALPGPAGGPLAVASRSAPVLVPAPSPAAVGSLRDQVAEASAEESAALDRLDRAAGRRRVLEREIGDTERQLSRAEAASRDAEERLAAADLGLAQVADRFGATARELEEARRRRAERAVSSYLHPPLAGVTSALLDGASLREAAAARDYLSVVAASHARAVARHVELRDRVEAERRDLAAARDLVAAERAALAGHHDELARRREGQAGMRARVAVEERGHAEALRDAKARVREFEAQLAAMTSESDALGAMLRARQGGQSTSRAGRGVLAAPVGGPVGSRFGPRRHPLFGTSRMHNGVDYGVPPGTPVRAAAGGVVVVAGWRTGYGNVVVIDHGNTLATLYAHQSSLAVGEGQVVGAGTTVGRVGSTGYSTGPHLHFEVRVLGNPVDPSRYL